jgi:flavin reductase (DIM6/NTAB) family NADH-FMN oxidoreductase RutF
LDKSHIMPDNFRRIDPKQTAIKDLHQFMVGAIAPRPIAFASTIDEAGVANLAPYSFFNAFSSNPPILVFSSNRRVKGNTTKDTLHNVFTNGEVVINVVNYDIVQQMAIASISYPSDVSEFAKSGLTPIASEQIRPFRVKESPVQMECKVKEIITLGENGGAGHLIICDVLCMHIAESVIDDRNRLDPHKLDLVGRLGRAYYVRASGNALFTVAQDQEIIALGFDQLPEHIRKSPILTGNEIGLIAGLTQLPDADAVAQIIAESAELQNLIADTAPQSAARQQALHQFARPFIQSGDLNKAAAVLLCW